MSFVSGLGLSSPSKISERKSTQKNAFANKHPCAEEQLGCSDWLKVLLGQRFRLRLALDHELWELPPLVSPRQEESGLHCLSRATTG